MKEISEFLYEGMSSYVKFALSTMQGAGLS